MAPAVSTARVKVDRPETMSPVSRLLIKLVNTRPGTSTMMEPTTAVPGLMGSPSPRATYTTSASTKPLAMVLMKKLERVRLRASIHMPHSRPDRAATRDSSQPPEKNREKNREPTK